MTLMTTGSTPSAAGYSEKSDATGPVAGVSPIMKMRAKVKDKKKLVMPGNKMKEDIDRINPHGPNRLFQYKVNIPEVGETIVYANSPAELRQKLRLIINPRFREGIDIERIFPGQAAQFFMQKRMQFMRNEAVDKENQQMAQGKIAIEKKKVLLKKQALQKQLQLKTQKLKKQVRAGAEQDETR
tara:strand:+ start:2454 stop:3005 length:552 start_codon:yes stop_codon:yes gene_type:complete